MIHVGYKRIYDILSKLEKNNFSSPWKLLADRSALTFTHVISGSGTRPSLTLSCISDNFVFNLCKECQYFNQVIQLILFFLIFSVWYVKMKIAVLYTQNKDYPPINGKRLNILRNLVHSRLWEASRPQGARIYPWSWPADHSGAWRGFDPRTGRCSVETGARSGWSRCCSSTPPACRLGAFLASLCVSKG